MSNHHSMEDLPPEIMDAFREQFDVKQSSYEQRVNKLEKSLGPTGRFPLGKVTESDEGETAMAVGHAKGRVFLNFGSPMKWIGFTPSQARILAGHLLEHANAAPLISPDGTPERVFHGSET